MFTPEIVGQNDGITKLRINNAIVLNIDEELFEKDNQLTIDFDETLITAMEAEELTNKFICDVVEHAKYNTIQQKGK